LDTGMSESVPTQDLSGNTSAQWTLY